MHHCSLLYPTLMISNAAFESVTTKIKANLFFFSCAPPSSLLNTFDLIPSLWKKKHEDAKIGLKPSVNVNKPPTLQITDWMKIQ